MEKQENTSVETISKDAILKFIDGGYYDNSSISLLQEHGSK